MQLLEVVTGHSQFLSDFSIPQAVPAQPVSDSHILLSVTGIQRGASPPGDLYMYRLYLNSYGVRTYDLD